VANRESKRIEFKREFFPSEPGAWCELLKDMAAIANSGGGVIVIGLNNDGSPSGSDVSDLLSTDPANITNILSRYLGEQFDGFDIAEGIKDGQRIATIKVSARVESPLVFEKPGTYSDGQGGQKTAFARGTVYFRHGAKSEPAMGRDLARFVVAEVSRHRAEWKLGLRRVANAPRGSQIIVRVPKAGPQERAEAFRIVDDPNAQAIARTDFDITHPYRQTDLIKVINERVGQRTVGPYEIQCVRRVFDVDNKPEFFHRPKFSSPQYSDALVSWLIAEYQRDPLFFEKTKEARRAASDRSSASVSRMCW
jgi:hypothetical protein